MSGRCADGEIERVAELDSGDGALLLGRVVAVIEEDVQAAVERGHWTWLRARIPALDDAVRVAAHEQLVMAIELATVVLVRAAALRLERRLKAALFQIETIDFVTFRNSNISFLS